MIKYITLLFCLVLAKAGHAQNYTAADTVSISKDTLKVSFQVADSTAGDTVYFGMNGGHDDKLLYFFQNNLRPPAWGDSMILGTIRVNFTVDKTGRVTQAWYDPTGNTDIGLSVLRVINQLPLIRPTSIKGEPMVTKVLLKVLIEKEIHSYTGNFVPDFTEVVGSSR